MKQKVLYAAIVGMNALTAANAASLGIPKGSSDFTYKYEGDALPTDPSYSTLGFTANDPAGIESQTVSLGTASGTDFIRIDTDTTNETADVMAYRVFGGAGTSWAPFFAGGFTVEFRAIVRPGNSGTIGAGVEVRDENSEGLFMFFNNKVVGFTSINTPANDDTFHTFRIASYSPDDSSAGQVYRIFRDGVSIGTTVNNAQFAGDILQFGDFVSFLPDINIDIDYFRWDTTGAYAPLPNPGWAINGSGDWNTPANWIGGVPNGAGSVAVLGNVITSAQTITTNTPITVGSLKFDNANSYQITGQGSLTLQVATGAASIDVTQGSHKINLPSIFASDTNITVANGATLTISNPMTIKASKTVTKTGALVIQAPLTIETNGVLNLGAGPAAVLFGAPTLATGAKVNVQNHSLVISYAGQATPAATIKAQLTSGYNNGAWNAAGITTSSSTAATGLGWKDDSGTESILIKYTYYGDADLSGTVTSNDFNALAASYGATAGANWVQGDFNYDGKVNTTDFNYLAGNFGATPLSVASLGTVVPEPASLSLLALGAVVARRRR